MDGPGPLLDVECDERFQRREWQVQRAGWVVLAALLLLAALGLFGGGPLSTQVQRAGALTLESERFTRYRSPQTLRIRVAPDPARDRAVTVLVSQQWLSSVVVEGVLPEPAQVVTGRHHVAYTFAVGDAQAPLQVRLDVRGDRVGRLRGEVALPDGPRVRFAQLSYP